MNMPLIGRKPAAVPAEWQSAEPLDPAAWIPLSALALEGFGYADALDTRVRNLCRDLAEEILLDDIGRACVPRSVARQMFADRAQQQLDAQARDRVRQEKLAAATQPLHDHVRALQRLHLGRESSGSALGDMMRDEFERNWDDAADKRDEINSGGLVYHPIAGEQEQ